MMVDSLENGFNDVFACWPFRYYIIDKGRIVHKAEPLPVTFAYDITTIEPLLKELAQRR